MKEEIEANKISKIYYVAPDGNDIWSGAIPQPTEDSKDGPFRTISAARDFVRKEISIEMNTNIEVQLRGGSYYLEEALIFDERDSGKNGNQIIYTNYKGELPVIHGGKCVAGWIKHDEKIYKVKLSENSQINILFENGTFAVKARYPKAGYVNSNTMDESSPKTKYHFNLKDIPKVENTNSIQAFLWPGGPEGDWNWFSQVINIKEIDYENQLITLNSEALYIIGEGSRYYIQGSLELLNNPGEFYFDSNEKTLYYIPRQLPIESREIIIPTTKEIIVFKGTSPDTVVKNIEFEGLSICHSNITEEVISVSNKKDGGNGSAIHLENAQDIVIKNCRIFNTGLHGVHIKGLAQNNMIYGNVIHDIGHTAVQLEGKLFTSKFINKANRIENNLIYNTGILVGHGAGIQLIQSGENYIGHNRIHHTPRYSISLKSFCPDLLLGREIDGITVTEENIEDFCYSRKNIIEYNDVSDGNYNSQDTGLIESWGINADNSICFNHVHDSNINFSFGFGIYIDDAAVRTIIYGNIINGLQREGKGRLLYPIYDKGYKDKIINNIVVDNNAFRASVGTIEMGCWCRNIISERNIFCNSGDIYYFQNWDDNRFAHSDFNLFYNIEGRYGVLDEIRDYKWGSKELGGVAGIKWKTLSLAEWSKVAGKSFDINSTIGDPLFVDQENGDYRLRCDSPAYNLGFEDIDYSSIGLKNDFEFTVGDDIPFSVFIKSDRGGCSCAVKLKPNEEAQLEVMARNEYGVILKLKEEAIGFVSENEDVAFVDDKGRITVTGKGTTKVSAIVGKKKSEFYVVVG